VKSGLPSAISLFRPPPFRHNLITWKVTCFTSRASRQHPRSAIHKIDRDQTLSEVKAPFIMGSGDCLEAMFRGSVQEPFSSATLLRGLLCAQASP
jgi:hypothetical protein